MRTRVFADQSRSGSWLYEWNMLDAPFEKYKEPRTHETSQSFDAMMDVVTPDFQKLKNQGVIINNPMARERITYEFLPSLVRDSRFRYGGRSGQYISPEFAHLEITKFSRTLPDLVAFQSSLEQYHNYEALAVTRAWANVAVNEAMLLASLGELPETLRWMSHVLQRVLSITRMLRSKSALLRNLPQLARAVMDKEIPTVQKLARNSARGVTGKTDSISEFANLWLEYRYAIRPLIFEYKQCLEALQKIIKKGTRETARGKELNLYKSSNVETFVRSGYSVDVTNTVRRDSASSLTARAGVLFEIENDLDVLLAVWGLDQPLESVYELVPFSFILDWFFNVGDVISSWSVNSSLRPLSSWVTYRIQHVESLTATSMSFSGKNGYTWVGAPDVAHGKSTVSVDRVWRRPSPERPILPRFDLKLDLAKIIDLGAIGRSILFGKSRS